MRLLATGAAGFIGLHLAWRLVDEDHRVVSRDNLNDYYDVALKYAAGTTGSVRAVRVRAD